MTSKTVSVRLDQDTLEHPGSAGYLIDRPRRG